MGNPQGLRKVSGVSFLEISDWLLSKGIPYTHSKVIEDGTCLPLDRIVRLALVWEPQLIERFGSPSGITEYPDSSNKTTVYGYRYKAEFVLDGTLPFHELERIYDMRNRIVVETTYIQYVP